MELNYADAFDKLKRLVGPLEDSPDLRLRVEDSAFPFPWMDYCYFQKIFESLDMQSMAVMINDAIDAMVEENEAMIDGSKEAFKSMRVEENNVRTLFMIDIRNHTPLLLVKFILRFMRYTREAWDLSVWIVALTFVRRLNYLLSEHTKHKLLGAVACVAAKFSIDTTFSNNHMALVMGVTRKTLNQLERAVLNELDWKLWFTPLEFRETFVFAVQSFYRRRDVPVILNSIPPNVDLALKYSLIAGQKPQDSLEQPPRECPDETSPCEIIRKQSFIKTMFFSYSALSCTKMDTSPQTRQQRTLCLI